MSDDKKLSTAESFMQVEKEQEEARSTAAAAARAKKESREEVMNNLKASVAQILLEEQEALTAIQRQSILGSVKDRPLLKNGGAPPMEPFASLRFERKDNGRSWIVFAVDALSSSTKTHLLAGVTSGLEDRAVELVAVESFDPTIDEITQDWLKEKVREAIAARL